MAKKKSTKVKEIDPKLYLEDPEGLKAFLLNGMETVGGGGGGKLFRPEYVEQARKLYHWGHIDIEVAEFFGVSEDTIRNWAAHNAAFNEARKVGKEAANERVAESLYQRARGYDKPIEKIFLNKFGQVVRVPTVEHIPADTKAARYYLNNRDPRNWADRRELTGAGGAPLHPVDRPKRSIIEMARTVTYMMQRAKDAIDSGEQPIMIEEKIIETTEE